MTHSIELINSERQNYKNGPCGLPKVTNLVPMYFFDEFGPSGLKKLYWRSFFITLSVCICLGD